MLIGEASKQTKLTKKAITYYEEQGLVKPEILENGYRNYSVEDILVLKEIAVLRSFDIDILKINGILLSDDKTVILLRLKIRAEEKITCAKSNLQGINELLLNYDIEKQFDAIQSQINISDTITDKIVSAFPGNYGLLLGIHFGKYLQGTVSTMEQERAFNEIIDYLDNVTMEISPELSTFLKTTFEQTDILNVLNQAETEAEKAIDNIDEYIETHQEAIETYIAYKQSEEFKNSPAKKYQDLLLEFQKSSGYEKKFLANLEILSAEYKLYREKVGSKNEEFTEKFPRTKDWY